MKFQFEAIDDRGTVLRRVLRAETEEDARETLLAEGIFPKRLQAVSEEEKVSWSPKAAARQLQARVHGQAEAPQTSEPDIRERTPSRLRQGQDTFRGILALRSDNSVMFKSSEIEIVIQREKVEMARLAGFPARVLRVSMIDGELLEFSAGLFVASPFYKRVVKALKS